MQGGISDIFQIGCVHSDGVLCYLDYGTSALLAALPQTNNHNKPCFKA